jgi:hypothetical protein
MSNRSEQERLIDLLLSGATTRDIREQIGGSKAKGKASQSSPKPKRVYHTAHKATVIVQATGNQLSKQQCIDALREALEQAGG